MMIEKKRRFALIQFIDNIRGFLLLTNEVQHKKIPFIRRLQSLGNTFIHFVISRKNYPGNTSLRSMSVPGYRCGGYSVQIRVAYDKGHFFHHIEPPAEFSTIVEKMWIKFVVRVSGIIKKCQISLSLHQGYPKTFLPGIILIHHLFFFLSACG